VNAAVIAEGPDAANQLRSLHEWLADVQELRGSVSMREGPPRPGTLGPVLEALAVALGPAGAATAFATAIIAWLRTRRGEVRIQVTLTDGRSVELTAKNLSNLDAAAVEQQVVLIANILSQGRDGVQRLEDS
jgi:Effector Associated Constant Component 1